MKKIGIIVNIEKEINSDYLVSIISFLYKNGYEIMITNKLLSLLGQKFNYYDNKSIYQNASMVIVFGGDGTILGNAREAAEYDVPLLGINMGHLGFITDVEVKETFESLNKLVNGDYHIEERMMLKTEVIDNKNVKKVFHCLNEVGISRGVLSKMLTMKICIDNAYFDSYHTDGILISTPTGSTAYSLSAGGPIINPNINAMLITPLCPHSLSARSIVVSENEVIEANIVNPYNDAYLTIDGQIGYNIEREDRIFVRKSEFTTKLVKISDRSFYDVLRTKLKERFI